MSRDLSCDVNSSLMCISVRRSSLSERQLFCLNDVLCQCVNVHLNTSSGDDFMLKSFC